MSIRLDSNLPPAFALALASLWIPQATAQTSATASVKPIAPAAVTEATPPAFRSALEGYRPYTDEKIVNWKEANDTTGQIGGWRAYAKEASQDSLPSGAALPANSATPAKP